MRTFFGLSQSALVWGVLALLVISVLALFVVGLRNPLVPRLALRNLPRRPGFAALITCSLTLGTIILSTSFTTGDTISNTVRSVVSGALGSVDEVLFVPAATRPTTMDFAQAVANGTFLTGLSDYFPEANADTVADALRGDARVAEVQPIILDLATASSTSGGLRATFNLIGAREGVRLFRPDRGYLSLATLGEDEVYVNQEAANSLGLQAGDTFRLYGLGQDTRDVRVADVARLGDLGGGQAAVFMPLERAQAWLGHPGQVNQVIVLNTGLPAQRLANAWPLTVKLRAAFTDERTAQRLFRMVSAPSVRQALEAAASRSFNVQQGAKLRALVRTLDAGQPTPEFIALVQDPGVLARVADRVPGGSGLSRGGPFGPSVSGDHSFRVLDVQEIAQEQADLWGSGFTNAFVGMGGFAIASGLLLVVLVFSLLALERRGELGILRALGGTRGDVVALLAMEGALYSLLSSLFGLGAGVLVSWGLLWAVSGLLGQYGLRVEPSVNLASLLTAFGLGVVLTFATVTLTAWRASAFSIVTAIRDLPDLEAGPGGFRGLLVRLLPGALGGVLLRLAIVRGWSVVYALGALLAIVGAALVAGWLLRRLGARGPERLVFSLAGLVLVGWWNVPPHWLELLHLPVFNRVAESSFLGGLSSLIGLVWLLAYNVGLLRALPGSAPFWRISLAYLATHRLRTGLTLAMFGLVVLSLTLGVVLLNGTGAAYGDPGAASGGWDIRGDSSQPLHDISADLDAGPAPRSAFVAVGASTTQPVEALQIGSSSAVSRWQPTRLMQVDDGFAEGVTAQLTSASGDPRSTWRQLTTRPGTAVVGAGLLESTSGGFRVKAGEGKAFQPVTLWLRDPASKSPSVRLQVVGIVDGRGPFGNAILAGRESFSAWPAPERASYYFAAPPGANLRELAGAISLSVQGVQAQPTAEELRLVQGVRGLLNVILQSFMGIGLVSGVAAVGVISLRAVVERRRQVGVLRALGFSARHVALGLLTESAVMALLGSGLGVAVGLVVARDSVAFIARQAPELRFVVPWEQLAGIVLLTLAASLLMTILPARQASHLSPAAALRDE